MWVSEQLSKGSVHLGQVTRSDGDAKRGVGLQWRSTAMRGKGEVRHSLAKARQG